MYKLLLHFLLIINIFVYVFILGSGFVSPDYAKLNIYVIIPVIFILAHLPYNLLTDFQYYVAEICKKEYNEYKDTSIDDIIKENSYIYILPKFKDNLEKKYPKQSLSPVNNLGLVLLSCIINTYLIKYYWKKI